MKTYNTSPYYDDFDDTKNFHQILFKPGYAVQARELSQLQTILRGQIEKFGNHVFQDGTVVIPGNSNSDLAAPYVKIASISPVNTNLSYFENKVVVNSTGVRGIVRKVVAATETDPITFYISYIGGDSAGNITYSNSDVLTIENTSITATLQSSSSTGIGSLAFVNTGVYYTRGAFVYVESQSVVISKYDSTPSCYVLLKINESVVDYVDDASLLDPAQGSYNYAAIGADRYKINLELVSIDLTDSVDTANYIELMRFKEGVLEEHLRYPKYNELEKSLARRTYDESGNYVVSGLLPKIREYLKRGNNDGLSLTGNDNQFVASVSPGKCYIEGFEVENIATRNIIIDKARTTKNKDINVQTRYGQYIVIQDPVGTVNMTARQEVELWNTSNPSEASATQVGTARVLAIDYFKGDPGQPHAIYKLWISNLQLDSGKTTADIGGIRVGSLGATFNAKVLFELNAPSSTGEFTVDEIVNYGASVRTGTVGYWDSAVGMLYVYKHDYTKYIPITGDRITGASSSTDAVIQSTTRVESVGQSNSIFRLPVTAVESFNTISYKVWEEGTINIAGGAGSTTITGSITAVEAGLFVAIGNVADSGDGIIAPSYFSVAPTGSNTNVSISGYGGSSTQVKVYAVVTRTLGAATKSATSDTFTYTPDVGDGSVLLRKADAYNLVRVTQDPGGVNEADITGSYILNSGQTDYAYEMSYLTLKPGKSIPAYDVEVEVEYYSHGSGDYFSIDSYSSITGEKYGTRFTSPSNGQSYDLLNCLDFRPTAGTDNNFNGLGAIQADPPVVEEYAAANIDFYVPRIDLLTIDKSGNIDTVTGVPAETPRTPNPKSGTFVLNQLIIPAYTSDIRTIGNRRVATSTYTMSDINGISNRIGRLEEFSTLTAVENNLKTRNVIDAATGLDRYKTGYLVEDFSNPFQLAEQFDPQFRSFFTNNIMTSAREYNEINLRIINSTTGVVENNGYLTLPYTERVLAYQPLSSRVTNVNPFLVISWNGTLNITPPVDTWTVTTELPDVRRTVTEVRTVERFVTNWIPPRNPPEPIEILEDSSVIVGPDIQQVVAAITRDATAAEAELVLTPATTVAVLVEIQPTPAVSAGPLPNRNLIGRGGTGTVSLLGIEGAGAINGGDDSWLLPVIGDAEGTSVDPNLSTFRAADENNWWVIDGI